MLIVDAAYRELARSIPFRILHQSFPGLLEGRNWDNFMAFRLAALHVQFQNHYLLHPRFRQSIVVASNAD